MTNIDDILRDLVKRLDEEDLDYLEELVNREKLKRIDPLSDDDRLEGILSDRDAGIALNRTFLYREAIYNIQNEIDRLDKMIDEYDPKRVRGGSDSDDE